MNTTHGLSSHPLYSTWQGMKARCSSDHPRYGGRGISVADEWLNDFQAFATFMGPKPSPEHSIDRINNDGNYAPGNVRWATRAEQGQNREIVIKNREEFARIRQRHEEHFQQLRGTGKPGDAVIRSGAGINQIDRWCSSGWLGSGHQNKQWESDEQRVFSDADIRLITVLRRLNEVHCEEALSRGMAEELRNALNAYQGSGFVIIKRLPRPRRDTALPLQVELQITDTFPSSIDNPCWVVPVDAA